jgi:hypothetical protein
MTPAWSGLLRFGGYRWETSSSVPTTFGMTSISNDGYDFMFGASVQYDFTSNFGLRGSFDRFNGIGSTDNTGDSKVNLLSVDAVLKF